ncbi:N-terminal acetyltransferase A, auxiliary subunit [Trema orientale]|uniref:N-terminal acetyltransferase A, auxiliary subunit n=1 Tax=Trema orientale TaxID=63057 RepID=A0A2P5F5W9_TREOI|nr:N-terminal acetyltransferase A, auxiliary subunit [Trema orientale]
MQHHLLPSPSPSPSSSSSPNPNFTLFFTPQNPSNLSKFALNFPLLNFHSSTRRYSSRDSSSAPVLDPPTSSGAAVSRRQDSSPEKLLVVRRPAMEVTPGDGEGDDDDDVGEDDEEELKSTAAIDAGLAEFAKKMPIFEPGERVGSVSQGKPLTVNLDLALYKAKVLTRSFRFAEAEEILQKCIAYWPEDGRAYVLLGKTLSKQSKTAEARAVYEKGCQATQGENPFIWQCWAILENKMGNIRRARELFDAATVADKRHIAAWHGWAVLELKQGNIRKARNLLAKALKFCGGNEYIYQTLALLEAKANRFEQARSLFRQATKFNPRSCASWLAWAQMEMQQENNHAARRLFEKAIQASPKNRFAWHVWGVFEANVGNVDKGRKLLKIGHALNPRDPVLLQSLALLEYKHSTANLARVLFRRASELDPSHQPVWMAWGWMEWKEGNISTARELYQKALSIDSTSETAARCLQAWGVLEQRVGNLSAARRLFRSSLNINSQSYITWMTWATFEEDQGNLVRAEEIRDLYFQQRTEVVDDASWVMGFLDIIDPAIDSVKRLLKLDQNSSNTPQDTLRRVAAMDDNYIAEDPVGLFSNGNNKESERGFDVDAFISERLSLDPSKLDFRSEVANFVLSHDPAGQGLEKLKNTDIPSQSYLPSFLDDNNHTAAKDFKRANSSHRKLLAHGSCTSRDIRISQSRDSTTGIPEYTVQIVNTCVCGCAPSNIHLHCGWFASARIIGPMTFKRLSYDDCLVNEGKPLKTSQIIRFTYSNSFMYPLSLRSAKFC